jgi:hypothetical protein
VLSQMLLLPWDCAGGTSKGQPTMPNKEGGLHPTPLMMEICKLAARLSSTRIPYASEASLSYKDGANNVGKDHNDSPVHRCTSMMVERVI